MTEMCFKEWLVLESLNPKTLLPYITHRKEQRVSKNSKNFIHNDLLRQDYENGIDRLKDIFTKENSLPVLMRKSMRQYEIVHDHMLLNSRHDKEYMISYNDTEPDNDLWMFCSALEDISNGKMPNLEKML